MTSAPAGGPDAGTLDLLVLGSGVAGLSAAVRAAEHHGMRVGVLTKGSLHQSTTRWAQGGVAAVLHEDPDSTDLHMADTLAAGSGLCDADAVRVLVEEGPARVNALVGLGAIFDRDEAGRFELAREGGHSIARVVHAGGAATGVEIERALVAAVQRSVPLIHEDTFAFDLVVAGGRCRGVRAIRSDGALIEVPARNVLLATGGAGQLYAVTTNPVEATGDGLAMARRAGVAVADVEFVQFHPTALHHPAMPRPLLSEALRGHGALLRDDTGERFVDELLARDEVSRAMTRQMLERGVEHLWLDARHLEGFDQRFPTIAGECRRAGLDPTVDLLPVAPAAHYLCGGVVADLDGACSLPGLWAAGEVACSGVHGANRLASNSLLEGMVFGFRVVEAIEAGLEGPMPTGVMRSLLEPSVTGQVGVRHLETPPTPSNTQPAHWSGTRSETAALRVDLQTAMTLGAGVIRTAGSLADAADAVERVRSRLGRIEPTEGGAQGPEQLPEPGRKGRNEADGSGPEPGPAELRNLCDVADVVLAAAFARTESRGAHTRDDHPTRDDARFRVRLVS